MSRRRYISPGFWEEEQAVRLSPCARLLLIGCWTLADDEGRLLWEPALLRERLFLSDPEVTSTTVREWMSELTATGAVTPYSNASGVARFGYIEGFETAHKTSRPQPSRLPAPPAISARFSESSSVRLTEPSTVGLSEGSVSRAARHSLSPSRVSSAENPAPSTVRALISKKVPLTCANTNSPRPHSGLTEFEVSAEGALIAASPTEREKERELERDGNPLSASRSYADPSQDESAPVPPARVNSAQGAGPIDQSDIDARNDHIRPPTSADHSIASPAPTDTTTPGTAPASEHDAEPEHDAESGHDAEPRLPADEAGTPPADPAPSGTHEGANSTMTTEEQESLFTVPEEMVREPSKKRKRAEPASWTPDRKETAHSILKPWWAMYGNGWPQSYGVVFNVLVSVLANKVTEEDIKRALMVLGPERKPISGGTIGFALSRTSKQVAEDAVFEAAASSRSASKYIRREM